MANVDNFHIAPEQEELFFRSCTLRPGFWGDKIDKKYEVFRTRNFGDLIAQSVFPTIAQWWNGMTDVMRARWTSAGRYSSQSGWDLFAQDTAYRIANGIPGLGEPTSRHQFKVGRIKIDSPASSTSIKQAITPVGASAFLGSLKYFSNLVSVGAGSYARLRFRFYANNGGGFAWYSHDEVLTAYSGWNYVDYSYAFSGWTVTAIEVLIEVYNMQGNLYFDCLEVIWNDINLAKDPNCDIVEANWLSVDVPAGASFQSVYSRNAFYYP